MKTIGMNVRDVRKILADNDFVRTPGSLGEARCAAYFQNACASLGLSALARTFPIPSWEEEYAYLAVDGVEIPCRARLGSPNKNAYGRLRYLEGVTDAALRAVKDCVVLTDRPISQELYRRLLAVGVRAIISTSGDVRDASGEIDVRPITFKRGYNEYIPWVAVHVRDALAIMKRGASKADVRTRMKETRGVSQNVILDFEGESDDTVVVSAHYDSTSLSRGAYDNLSGSIVLLYLAKRLSEMKLARRVRLLWCGAEEWGLLGSLAYCDTQAKDAPQTVLNVNLDMLGCTMGEMVAFSSADEETVSVLEKFGAKNRVPLSVRYGIRSSDSNSFVRAGVPSVSFARYAPASTVQIHTALDTPETVDPRRLLCDAELVARFVCFAANDEEFCKHVTVSEKIRGEVETYFHGKI